MSTETTAHEVPTPSAKPSEFDPRDYRSLGNWEVALERSSSLTLRGQIVALYANLALVRLLEGTSPSIVSGPGMIEFKTKSNPFAPALLIDYRWRHVRQLVDGARYVFLGIDTLVWAKPTRRLLEPNKNGDVFYDSAKDLAEAEAKKIELVWGDLRQELIAWRERALMGLGVPANLIENKPAKKKEPKDPLADVIAKLAPYANGDPHCRYCGANKKAYEGHAKTCTFWLELKRLEKDRLEVLNADRDRTQAKWAKMHHVPTREEFLKTFERRMPPKRKVMFHLEPKMEDE